MSRANSLKQLAFYAAVVALAIVAQVQIWTTAVPGPKEAVVPIVLLSQLPLLLRRRFPLAAPACAFVMYGALSFAHRETVSSLDTNTLTLLLAFWAVGAQQDVRQAVAGVAIGLASVAVLVKRDARIESSDAVGVVIAGAGLALAAFALQRRARRTAELEEQAVRVEREREERERAAVAEERRRIARDLHDVVAHSVGVMIAQAGAARLQLEDEPGRARAPLLAVEGTGREALAELRRLLGILRRRDDAGVALTPQPGLADLEDLLAQARGAGLPVELSVQGTAAPLPPGVELTAYRIVQEALTNARKHAGPARAWVTVRYGPDALELEIVDDGRSDATGAAGHGLVGMRERAALYNGELDAGAGPQGGFAVRARLPLEASGHRGTISASSDGDAERPGNRAESVRSVRDGLAFDVLVVALAAISELEIWLGSVPGPKPVLVPAVLLYTLPLLLRRRLPFAAPTLAFAVQAVITFAGEAVGSESTGLPTLLLTFWAVGAHNRQRRHAIAGAAIGFASLAVIVQWDERFGYAQLVNGMALGAGLASAAFALQRRARRTAELEERAVRVERERDESERAAVAEERRRIARDLHDVVAHSVGVMTVQAGAARLQLDDEPGRARAPLMAVEETGRQALSELRRLLGILRRDDGGAAPTPQPGLGDIDGLVAQARRAGLPVELSVQGTPGPVPPGLDLTAYRIVQEGLTNTRKHAGPARAWVAVRYAADALELEIVDDGRIIPTGAAGHGLVGMRERAALYGGELEAGAQPQGGFVVRARLPFDGSGP